MKEKIEQISPIKHVRPMGHISPIYPIKSNNITDFSFDIFCRLKSTENHSPFEGEVRRVSEGLKGDVDRIKKYGVLNPIRTCGKTLIAGFEQFAAAQAAGLEEIPAFVLPEDTSKEELLDLSLELIGAKKQIPLMAMARLTVLTAKTVDNPVKWLRERRNQHFWSITIDVFSRLKSLAASPVEVCDYFQKYDAPLSAAMSVINLSPDFQKKIIKWANENRVRPIELERIITDLADCSKVEKKSSEKIWEGIFEEDKNLLKKNLNERKNPLLSKLRKEKNNLIKEFEKTTGMKLSFDKDFENPEIEFKFKCKSVEEFKEKMEKAVTRTAQIFHE